MVESAVDEAGLDLLVETVQQLGTEFPSISTGDVMAMVMECRHDLSAVPPAAEPELIERLARVRLDLLGAKNAPTVRTIFAEPTADTVRA